MRNHHYIAAYVFLTALMFAAISGTLFASAERLPEWLGLYWAVSTVTTTGYGDITPRTPAGYIIASACMLLAIPVWTSAFGFFYSWVISLNLADMKTEIKDHVQAVSNGNGKSASP